MRRRLNSLLLAGIIGTAVFGSMFAEEYSAAIWGRQNIWWTPLELALPLSATGNDVELYIGDKLLQRQVEQGVLAVKDETGAMRPVGPCRDQSPAQQLAENPGRAAARRSLRRLFSGHLAGLPWTGLSPDATKQTKQEQVGIIRCQQTEDICPPGTTDFKVAPMGELGFEPIGPAEIISFVSCGGCPGKRSVARAKMLVDRGAEGVAFASCISLGKPLGMACPHFALMKEAVAKKLGPDIPLLDYTH